MIRRDGSVDPTPWADVNARYRIRWTHYYHGGLSGIAFDPDFSRNRFVYVVTQVPNKRTGFAEKYTGYPLQGSAGTRDLAAGHPHAPGQELRQRLQPRLRPRRDAVPAERLPGTAAAGEPLSRDLFGKILRVTPTGEAPGDNPYGRRAPRVWATGFKNAFDLAFFPRRDLAVAGENGRSVTTRSTC